MADDSSMPPAGWYPDPEGAPGQRYWTGTSWADPRLPDPSSIYPAQTVPTDPVAVATSHAAAVPTEPHGDTRPARAVGPFGLSRATWVVGTLVIVALVAVAAYSLTRNPWTSPNQGGASHHAAPSPGTPGGPPKPGLSTYTAQVSNIHVLAPYAVGVNLTVTNTGTVAARPTCVLTATSSTDPAIKSTSTVYPTSVPAGTSAASSWNVTVPKNGAKKITSVTANCT